MKVHHGISFLLLQSGVWYLSLPTCYMWEDEEKKKCLVSKYTRFKLDMVTHAYNPSTHKLSQRIIYLRPSQGSYIANSGEKKILFAHYL